MDCYRMEKEKEKNWEWEHGWVVNSVSDSWRG